MATLLSNELKAVMVTENFLETPRNILKENCLTVQHFNYECMHKKNESGEIYGAINPVILDFTVRINSPLHTLLFYKELVSNEHFSFSFLFNVTYDANQRIKSYEDGMVVDAFIVRMEEVYQSKGFLRNLGTGTNDTDSQMLLHVKLLVRSVAYLGVENHFNSVFIR